MSRYRTIDDMLHDLVNTDDESARVYLLESFLDSVVDTLSTARKRAGLTQQDLAERLTTRQSVVSRSERDVSGSMSVRRFAEWSLACGFVPAPISLVPFTTAREQALSQLRPRQRDRQPMLISSNVSEIAGNSLEGTGWLTSNQGMMSGNIFEEVQIFHADERKSSFVAQSL